MNRSDAIKRFVFFPLLALLVISTAIGIYFINKDQLTPLKLFNSPLRAGNRVFLLTGQWKTRIGFTSGRASSRTIRTTDLHVELWCFDAKTVKPEWRKRLVTERNGAMYNYKLLGGQGDLIWISTPNGPLAASMKDGTLKANTASIEQKNPELKSLLPKDDRFYYFDAQGLLMTALDARTWRFDPATLQARQAKAAPPDQQRASDVYFISYLTPNSTPSFVSRNIPLPGRWFGLLTENELESFQKTNSIGGIEMVSRRRLYSAKGVKVPNFPADYWKYQDFKPAGKEYLGPGLLSYHRPTGPYDVMWARNPDSVFVLHRDRLGEEGKLRLARVAGPAGNEVWEVALPLSVLQSALPGPDSVVLYGVEYTPPKNNQPRDPMHTALERLIGIDLANGQMSIHDQSDHEHHIEATPENTP